MVRSLAAEGKVLQDIPEFILASRSPRRSELLRQAGYRFRVVPPPLAEPLAAAPGSSPAQVAEALAYFKVRSVQADHPEEMILGADTVVACGDQILGKACDEAEARRILSIISGARHNVTTGVALLVPDGSGGQARRLLAAETSYVTMRRLSQEQIDQYVASGQWRGKAGAYAIQESGDELIEGFEGSFTNVVGLPMELLERMLAKARRLLQDSRGG